MSTPEDYKAIDPLWNIHDTLTVHQAVSLIAGFDPTAVRFDDSNCAWLENRSGRNDSERSKLVDIALAALCNAINSGKAMMRRNARIGGWDEYPNVGELARYDEERDDSVFYRESPDWVKTTVDRPDLIAWLESRDVRSGFFFPNATDAPDYLDKSNPRYAPKLDAAIRAWQAVTDTNGKSAKSALSKWLREHAADFAPTDDDGKIYETGIEEVAKVANWQPAGGAPKTPGA